MSQVSEKIKRFTASEAIPAYRRVKLASGTSVALAGADEVAIGISDAAALIGGEVPVAFFGNRTHKVVASAAVAAGTSIYGTASGKIDDAGAGSASEIIGFSLEAADADGDVIECILWSNPESMGGGLPGIHGLVSALHSVAGLTPGHVLQALTASTFGFAAAGGGGGNGPDFTKITLVGMAADSVGGVGSVIGTYTTIQAALDAIPAATDNDSATRVHYVFVPGGTYDEALSYDVTRKRAVLVAMGLVNIGKFTGANWTPSTYRDFTIQLPTAGNYNSIRHSLHLCSWTPHVDKSESHCAYMGGWRLSGTLIGVNGAVSTGCEINISDTEIFGNSSKSIDWATVVSVSGLFYAHKCRFRNEVNLGANFELVFSERTDYNANVTARSFSFLWGCGFAASKTFTITTTPGYYKPNGFHACSFGTGYTFSGPASSFVVDPATDYYSANVTLSGGATKVVLQAAAPGSDMLSVLTAAEVSVTTTANLTIGRMHVCSDTGTPANYTVTLPAASGNTGKFLGVRMADGLTKLVTVDGNGSETINGELNRIMWAGESAILMCDGSNWFKVAGKSKPIGAKLQGMPLYFVADADGNELGNWQAAVYDDVGGWNSAKRWIAPRPGRYAVKVEVQWAFEGSVYARALALYAGSGSAAINGLTNNIGVITQKVEDTFVLAAGDACYGVVTGEYGSLYLNYGTADTCKLVIQEVNPW